MHAHQEQKWNHHPNHTHDVRVDQEAFKILAIVGRILDPIHECDDFACVCDEEYEELKLDEAGFLQGFLEDEDAQLAEQLNTCAEVD